MAGIVIPAWSTADRIPRVVFALQFGQGGSSGALTDYALFVGARAYDATTPTPVAVGTAVDAVPDQCFSADDAARKWGYGSDIHREAIAWFEAYPGSPAWAVSWAKGGGSPARSTKTQVLSGSPTESKTMIAHVAGTEIPIYVASGTVLADIGADIAAACSLAELPTLVSFLTDTLTWTAKCYGVQGDSIRIRFSDLPAGLACTNSDTVLAGGADGTTPGWSAAYAAAFALDTIFYHIIPATVTAATLNAGTGNLRTRIKDNCAPTVGKLSDVWLGCVGTVSNAQTLTDAVDLGTTAYDEPGYWFTVAWAPSTEVEPWFLAAQMGGTCALAESVSAVQNWVGLEGGPTLDLVPLPPSVTSFPTDTELNDAIAHGVSPCYYVYKQNATKVCTCVTAKHLIGAADDPSYVEHPNIRAVARAVSYGVRATLAAAYSGFTFVANDEIGGVPETIGPRQVCPREVVEKLMTIMKQDYQSAPRYWVQNVEAHRGETTAEIAATPAGRLVYELPIDVPVWADQIGGIHRALRQ